MTLPLQHDLASKLLLLDAHAAMFAGILTFAFPEWIASGIVRIEGVLQQEGAQDFPAVR